MANNFRRTDSDRSDSSVDSRESSDGAFSSCTKSTARSEYSEKPAISRGDTWPSAGKQQRKTSFSDGGAHFFEYTAPLSPEELSLEELPSYEQDDEGPEYFGTDAVPASEPGFRDLFPSTRQRLDIRHDDATSDGNMNIRIDTNATTRCGRDQKVTLFHLRMYDLKTREFSLRRYCRDSGREVCHTSRKTKAQQQAKRPTFTRSLSNALTKSFASKKDLRSKQGLQRQDSGDAPSRRSEDDDFDEDEEKPKSVSIEDLSDTINLQFLDYSHLDVTRTGQGTKRGYDFEYWGEKYSWKKVSRVDFGLPLITYHLVRRADGKVLAHITPKQDGEAQRDQEEGGWIPPSNFWLLDDHMSLALADKVVATGLIAFADDIIRTVYASKEQRQTQLASMSPKRMFSGVFSREPGPRPHTAH